MFKLAWIILGLLLIAYLSAEFIGIPVSLAAGAVALFFIIATRRSPAVETRRVIKEAPWSIVVFSIGMYVVVYGLRNVGLTAHLGDVIQWLADQGYMPPRSAWASLLPSFHR